MLCWKEFNVFQSDPVCTIIQFVLTLFAVTVLASRVILFHSHVTNLG